MANEKGVRARLVVSINGEIRIDKDHDAMSIHEHAHGIIAGLILAGPRRIDYGHMWRLNDNKLSETGYIPVTDGKGVVVRISVEHSKY
jgi:hypothetical protein